MAKRPKRGLSIEEAFRRYADPALLARLDELEPHANQFTVGVTEHFHDEYRRVHETINDALVERLERGELIARGLVRGATVTEGKVDVDPERWAELEFYYDLDEIVGPKRFVMTAVEIREADPDEAEGAVGSATQAKEGHPIFEHDPNYRWVRLRGVLFKLGPHQARVVRMLHGASGTEEPWVHGKELLRQKPPIRTKSIRDLFKSKANWTQLIESDWRGAYRLNLPKPRPSGA